MASSCDAPLTFHSTTAPVESTATRCGTQETSLLSSQQNRPNDVALLSKVTSSHAQFSRTGELGVSSQRNINNVAQSNQESSLRIRVKSIGRGVTQELSPLWLRNGRRAILASVRCRIELFVHMPRQSEVLFQYDHSLRHESKLARADVVLDADQVYVNFDLDPTFVVPLHSLVGPSGRDNDWKFVAFDEYRITTRLSFLDHNDLAKFSKWFLRDENIEGLGGYATLDAETLITQGARTNVQDIGLTYNVKNGSNSRLHNSGLSLEIGWITKQQTPHKPYAIIANNVVSLRQVSLTYFVHINLGNKNKAYRYEPLKNFGCLFCAGHPVSTTIQELCSHFDARHGSIIFRLKPKYECSEKDQYEFHVRLGDFTSGGRGRTGRYHSRNALRGACRDNDFASSHTMRRVSAVSSDRASRRGNFDLNPPKAINGQKRLSAPPSASASKPASQIKPSYCQEFIDLTGRYMAISTAYPSTKNQANTQTTSTSESSKSIALSHPLQSSEPSERKADNIMKRTVLFSDQCWHDNRAPSPFLTRRLALQALFEANEQHDLQAARALLQESHTPPGEPPASAIPFSGPGPSLRSAFTDSGSESSSSLGSPGVGRDRSPCPEIPDASRDGPCLPEIPDPSPNVSPSPDIIDSRPHVPLSPEILDIRPHMSPHPEIPESESSGEEEEEEAQPAPKPPSPRQLRSRSYIPKPMPPPPLKRTLSSSSQRGGPLQKKTRTTFSRDSSAPAGPSAQPVPAETNYRRHRVPAVPEGVTLYRTKTKRPLQEGEEVSDSDDSPDESWLKAAHHRDLDQHAQHVSPAALQFYKAFDDHLMDERPIADFHMADCVRRFAHARREWLNANDGERRREFAKHLIGFQLRGIIDMAVLIECMDIIKGDPVARDDSPIDSDDESDDPPSPLLDMARGGQVLRHKAYGDCKVCGEDVIDPADERFCWNRQCLFSNVYHRSCFFKQRRALGLQLTAEGGVIPELCGTCLLVSLPLVNGGADHETAQELKQLLHNINEVDRGAFEEFVEKEGFPGIAKEQKEVDGRAGLEVVAFFKALGSKRGMQNARFLASRLRSATSRSRKGKERA